MKQRSIYLLLVGVLVVAIIALTSITFWTSDETRSKNTPDAVANKIDPAPSTRSIRGEYIPSRRSLPGQPALGAMAPFPTRPEDRSPLADPLNRPNQPVATDLAIVYNLLEEYRRAYGAFPTGENNAQIVNALAGNNKKRLAFLPRESPALSAQGELIDRWGSPYFFHILSSQQIEIRSAGLDQQLWTSDDVIRPTH